VVIHAVPQARCPGLAQSLELLFQIHRVLTGEPQPVERDCKALLPVRVNAFRFTEQASTPRNENLLPVLGIHRACHLTDDQPGESSVEPRYQDGLDNRPLRNPVFGPGILWLTRFSGRVGVLRLHSHGRGRRLKPENHNRSFTLLLFAAFLLLPVIRPIGWGRIGAAWFRSSRWDHFLELGFCNSEAPLLFLQLASLLVKDPFVFGKLRLVHRRRGGQL